MNRCEVDRCLLCGSTESLEHHHMIPKSVIRQVRKDTDYCNPHVWQTVKLCPSCHRRVHEAFIEHLIQDRREGVCIFNAIRFLIVQEFLKSRHPKIWKEYRDFYHKFLWDEVQRMFDGLKNKLNEGMVAFSEEGER